MNLASETERPRFCWLPAFSPRIQLFITVFQLLHYLYTGKFHTFIAQNRINEDTKQNTLSRPETAQPLSTNHKRGGQIAAKRAEYTDTRRDTVVISRGGKNAGARPHCSMHAKPTRAFIGSVKFAV